MLDNKRLISQESSP